MIQSQSPRYYLLVHFNYLTARVLEIKVRHYNICLSTRSRCRRYGLKISHEKKNRILKIATLSPPGAAGSHFCCRDKNGMKVQLTQRVTSANEDTRLQGAVICHLGFKGRWWCYCRTARVTLRLWGENKRTSVRRRHHPVKKNQRLKHFFLFLASQISSVVKPVVLSQKRQWELISTFEDQLVPTVETAEL